MVNINGNKIFQIFLAVEFLNGLKNGIALSSIITRPTIQAIRASNLKPKIKAEPENAFCGGLYCI